MKGEILVRRGERLTPDALGNLLSAGFQSVPAFAKPRVLFLPAGDELVPAGGAVPPGKNVESNSVMICAMLRRYGCQAAAQLLATGRRREPLRVAARLTEDVPGRWMDFMQPVRLFWENGVFSAQPLVPFGKNRAHTRQPIAQILYCLKEKGFSAGETVCVELPASE